MSAPAPVTLTGKVRLRVFVAPTLVGIPVLLVVLASLGGLTESQVPGLPVVPFATLVSLPVDIWIRDLATAITVGGAIVGGLLAPRPDARIGRLTSGAALVWLAALAAQAVLTVSNVLAMPLRSSLDPAIVRSIALVVRSAKQAGIPCALCGAMAAELMALPVLLGLGVYELSVEPTAVPEIKEALRRIDLREAERLVAEVLTLPGAEEVEDRVRTAYGPVFHDLLASGEVGALSDTGSFVLPEFR